MYGNERGVLRGPARRKFIQQHSFAPIPETNPGRPLRDGEVRSNYLEEFDEVQKEHSDLQKTLNGLSEGARNHSAAESLRQYLATAKVSIESARSKFGSHAPLGELENALKVVRDSIVSAYKHARTLGEIAGKK